VFYQNGTVIKELIVWPESPSIVLVVLIWLSVVLENKVFGSSKKVDRNILNSLYENSPATAIFEKTHLRENQNYKIFFK
jgi:hypothetical protein